MLLAYVGYNERDKSMLKQNLDKTKDALHKASSKVQVLEAQKDDIKEDLARIDKKLDKLIDKLVEPKV